jgi:hypothetical protein
MNKNIFLSIIFASLAMAPGAALAYIGPGTTGGAIAAAFGFLGAVFLAIVAVIYYPIKRMLKGKKSSSPKPGTDKPAE